MFQAMGKLLRDDPTAVTAEMSAWLSNQDSPALWAPFAFSIRGFAYEVMDECELARSDYSEGLNLYDTLAEELGEEIILRMINNVKFMRVRLGALPPASAVSPVESYFEMPSSEVRENIPVPRAIAAVSNDEIDAYENAAGENEVEGGEEGKWEVEKFNENVEEREEEHVEGQTEEYVEEHAEGQTVQTEEQAEDHAEQIQEQERAEEQVEGQRKEQREEQFGEQREEQTEQAEEQAEGQVEETTERYQTFDNWEDDVSNGQEDVENGQVEGNEVENGVKIQVTQADITNQEDEFGEDDIALDDEGTVRAEKETLEEVRQGEGDLEPEIPHSEAEAGGDVLEELVHADGNVEIRPSENAE